MHLETLLYMVLQSDNACPPSTTPDFEALARQAEKNAVPNEWIEVPASTINIGMNDAENDDGPDRYFGWDNEKPQRSVSVPAFESKARPLTNEDYARFLDESQQQSIPASWMINEAESVKPVDNRAVRTNANAVYLNGSSPDLRETYLQGKYVRTIYGPVPLKLALHWPVFASYDELVSCARWMNGRIPTADEVHSIYHHVDINKNKHTDSITTRKVSAVNGHLSNDGVEISPPPDHFRNGAPGAEHSLDPGKLFADLEGCNVGFQRFHPTPVTQNGSKLCGQGDMGGVWEWTSSVLEMHKGFEPMALYPGYTHDFFDGKHNVVLGGSWATHPRIAGRKSL
ncbi:hypothetical protein MMC21_005392 [Puttea exsequens]|nr:hypothetical protein [Puttea exsequens]